MAPPSSDPAAEGKIKVGELEDDLRKMILGNVTISNGQNNQNGPHGPQQHYFRGRGRGRGRGGFQGGRGDGNVQAQASRGQHGYGNMPADPVPYSAMRGSPHSHSAGRGSPHPRFNRESNAPSPPADGLHQTQALTGTGRPPNASQQFASHNAKGPTEASAAQLPRLLQRPPQSNTNLSNAPHHQPRQYFPRPQPSAQSTEDPMTQVNYLDQLASREIPKVEITMPELEEKETFRSYLEGLCQKALAENYSGDIATISLVGFGSLASGFATPGSDMDLAVVPGWKDPSKAHEVGIDRNIPRLLEKVILGANMGARLLTRTRVPILKVCQKPSEDLYNALSEERQKWDNLPEEEKYAPPAPPPERTSRSPVDVDGKKDTAPVHNFNHFPSLAESMAKEAAKKTSDGGKASSSTTTSSTKDDDAKDNNNNRGENGSSKQQNQRNDKPWVREKTKGALDFPKSGVGIQCDINFENPLGIHNTHLLRCYSFTDPRVRPIVLFIKAWAKRRKINSSYSGTLSSYGWVLMVLHYLVNVAQPPVCPNLQGSWKPTTNAQGEHVFQDDMIAGYMVRFWRNEDEILHAARSGQLTRNNMSVGALLRGFFQYYSSMPQAYTYGPRPPTFYWTNEVLSLRTPGGVRMKSEKGWTGAKTTISNGKEVRNRYLFCIEDPFELDHNVARTVTHHGIVAIRDEFRRAWRILSAVGRGQQPVEGGIFDEIVDQPPKSAAPTPTKAAAKIRDEDELLAATTGQVAGDQEIDGKVDGQPDQASTTSSVDGPVQN